MWTSGRSRSSSNSEKNVKIYIGCGFFIYVVTWALFLHTINNHGLYLQYFTQETCLNSSLWSTGANQHTAQATHTQAVSLTTYLPFYNKTAHGVLFACYDIHTGEKNNYWQEPREMRRFGLLLFHNVCFLFPFFFSKPLTEPQLYKKTKTHTSLRLHPSSWFISLTMNRHISVQLQNVGFN